MSLAYSSILSLRMFMKFIAVICLLFSSYAYCMGDQTGIGENGFYTTKDLIRHDSTEIRDLLKVMLRENPERNIVFYIHGRSKTLKKEWTNINTMEKIYNVRVLMLHWESWNSMLDRPVENTFDGAEDLREALIEIDQFKKENLLSFKNKKMIMLFHSMGNIILKNYLVDYKDEIGNSSLFDSIILNGADTPFSGHRKWLRTLNLSPDIYVVMNNNDEVLLASLAHDYMEFDLNSKNDDRLGLGIGLDNIFLFNSKLSENSLYFDISKIVGADHRHYLSTNPNVVELFRYMFKEKYSNIPLKHKFNKNYFRF